MRRMLYVIHRLPKLKLLDYSKEREAARRQFGVLSATTSTAEEPAAKKAKTFTPGEVEPAPVVKEAVAQPKKAAGPTAEQLTAIKVCAKHLVSRIPSSIASVCSSNDVHLLSVSTEPNAVDQQTNIIFGLRFDQAAIANATTLEEVARLEKVCPHPSITVDDLTVLPLSLVPCTWNAAL
eukprot:1177767-Prorocentrum_minimum.AAC.4